MSIMTYRPRPARVYTVQEALARLAAADAIGDAPAVARILARMATEPDTAWLSRQITASALTRLSEAVAR